MKPIKGNKIKVIFRNGLSEYGIVETWSDKESVIKIKDSKDVLIIQNTSQDVMAIKITVDDISVSENFSSSIELNYSTLDKINSEISKIDEEENRHYVPDLTLRAKKLVELKMEQAQLEKEQIKKNLLRADLGKVQAVNYELPSSIFSQNTGAISNTGKKS